MRPITHTDQCLQAQAEQVAFANKYPNHCKRCGGRGTLYCPGDWVPYGSTSAQLPGGDEPCRCEEQNLCPRCGSRPVGFRGWMKYISLLLRFRSPKRIWRDEGNPRDPSDGYHENCPLCGYRCMACNVPGSEGQEVMLEYECYCWEAEARREEEESAREYEELMRSHPRRCGHGKTGSCDACDRESDFAFDVARERRAFGR